MWKQTELSNAYGGGFDPLDVDHEYVRKGDEVRWVEVQGSLDELRFLWRPADKPDEPLTNHSSEEWLAWTGEEVEGVEQTD